MKRAVLDAVLAARAEGRAIALATDLAGGRQSLVPASGEVTGELALSEETVGAARAAIRDDRSRTLEGGEDRLFVQVFNPPLQMIVVGAVHIAQALVPMRRSPATR